MTASGNGHPSGPGGIAAANRPADHAGTAAQGSPPGTAYRDDGEAAGAPARRPRAQPETGRGGRAERDQYRRRIRAIVRRLARTRARETAPARPAQPGQVTGLLAGLRRAALTAIAILVASASLVSFAESYRGLYEWAAHHGPGGIWVAIWPLMVDVFIAVGELTLFVALIDQWPARARTGAWAITLGGLAVSVTGNIGHVAGHSLANRGTAAVPPLAAAISLSVGMGVLKRVVASRPATADPVTPQPVPQQRPAPGTAATRSPAARRPGRSGTGGRKDRHPPRAPLTAETVAAHFAPLIAAGGLPSQKEIRSQWNVGSTTAKRVVGDLEAQRRAVPAS